MNIITFHVPSEKTIKARIRSILFGSRVHCPYCNTTRVSALERRYWCGKCRRKFSLTSCSFLAHKRISWKKLYILLLCFCKRYQPSQAADLAGVSLPTARRWYSLFREHLPSRYSMLSGIVCIDEMYVGKQKTGNQRIVIGGIVPLTGEFRYRIIDTVDQPSVEQFLADWVDCSSFVYTDSHKAYDDIEWLGYGHETDNHEKFQLARTVPIERVWSSFKRFLRRMYHHVWARNLEPVLREF